MTNKFSIRRTEAYLGSVLGRVRLWRVTCPQCPRGGYVNLHGSFLDAVSIFEAHRKLHSRELPRFATGIGHARFAAHLSMHPGDDESRQFRN